MKIVSFLVLILFMSCQEVQPSKTVAGALAPAIQSQNCIIPKLEIFVPLNTTTLVTTFDNSDPGKSCEARKSTAVVQCPKGKLLVSGVLSSDLNCISNSGNKQNASCTHPAVGTILSGSSRSSVTYTQPSVLSPANCDSVKRVLSIACQNGIITTTGNVGSFQSCIQGQPQNVDCFDSTSQRSISTGSSIQITSYRGPEYFALGLCQQNELKYQATCANGVVTRSGSIGQFLNCQELTSARSGKGQFTFVPYGPPQVPCRGTFQITIENKSNKQMYLNQGSLSFIGPTTQLNYLRDIQIIDSGCFAPQGLPPNAGCGMTIKNNIPLAKNHVATPLVSIKARYGTEANDELIDTGIYNGFSYSPFIMFQGCQ